MTPEARIDISNGIWVCQNHGTQIDRDVRRFTVEALLDARRIAEDKAFAALMGRVESAGPESRVACQRADAMLPVLLSEMRRDLMGRPYVRRIAIATKATAAEQGDLLPYFLESHPDLQRHFDELVALKLARPIAGTVGAYDLVDAFAEYLLATPAPAVAVPESGPARVGDVFDEKVGVWFDPVTGHRLCPRCRRDGHRSPLRNGEEGYRCTACTGYFVDPDRRLPYFAPPTSGGFTWS